MSSSSDRTVRAWKIADGSHLVFRGHKGSIDNVQVLEESTFATGGQDGMISIWKDTQKHATASVTAAHGYDSNLVNARWITSLSTIKMSDLLFSGSYDGYLRGWSASIEKRKIQSIINIPVEGIINSISTTNQIVVAGTGKEHKYGRWWSIKGNKNKVVTFRFPELLGEMAKATELLQEEEESIEQSDYSDEVSDED